PGPLPRRSLCPCCPRQRADLEMSAEATFSTTGAAARPRRAERDACGFTLAAVRKLLPLAGIGTLLALWQLLAASGLYTVAQLPGTLDALRASREVWTQR